MDILFICCDIGETRALTPVMHELVVHKADFNIMVMGAAIEEVRKDTCLQGRVVRVIENIDTIKERSKPLDQLADAIKGLNPLVIISGPASKAQEQLLESIPAKHKIVYLDNFNYATSNPYFETVKGVAKVAEKILCVSTVVENQMKSILDKEIKPLGRPSLESWVRQIKHIDPLTTREKIGFDHDKKTITFIGGYGPRYDGGVHAAYESAQAELEKAGYQVHIQHHPNLKKVQPLTTVEAVGMADFIICYDSTVGFEALFAEKQVIYLQPEGVEPYDNIALQKNLATKVHTNVELLEALKSASTPQQEIYEILGVQRDSTSEITKYVLDLLVTKD